MLWEHHTEGNWPLSHHCCRSWHGNCFTPSLSSSTPLLPPAKAIALNFPETKAMGRELPHLLPPRALHHPEPEVPLLWAWPTLCCMFTLCHKGSCQRHPLSKTRKPGPLTGCSPFKATPSNELPRVPESPFPFHLLPSPPHPTHFASSEGLSSRSPVAAFLRWPRLTPQAYVSGSLPPC